MQVHNNLNNLPAFKNAAITIGTFDGVHTGHVQIIRQLKDEALNNQGESVIITFDPHPRMVVGQQGGDAVKLLNTLDEKIGLLEKQEIDHLVVVPFTLQFSEQDAADYIEHFLATRFHPKTIIIGHDHHFGKGRSGNYKLLEDFADKFGYTVKEIPEQVLNHVIISSTKIRKALTNSDISAANDFLGYDYFMEGEVMEGDKLGRTIGFPTANIHVKDEHKLIPGNGVYVIECSLGKQTELLRGMMNIGFRPTVGGTKRIIEAHLFNFGEVIYGKGVRIYFKRFLRKEIKFSGLESLKEQLHKDKSEALSFFSSI